MAPLTAMQQHRVHDSRWLGAALWVLLVVFCLAGVFGRSLSGPNEALEGGVVADMFRYGTVVVPTIDGQPFYEKPPLLYWTALSFCRAAGGLSEGLIRLPSALGAFGTLVLMHLFLAGRRRPAELTHSRVQAWAAVFLCATTALFAQYARIVLTDMMLTFAVTLALFLFWRAYEAPAVGWRRWAPFLVVAAAAFYAKGLIGPGLVWCAVGAFLAWKRRFGQLARLAVVFAVVLAAVVAPWAWALWRQGGAEALRAVFWDNEVGRFLQLTGPGLAPDPFFVDKRAWHFYLTHLPASLAPWTLLLPLVLWDWFRRGGARRSEFDVFLRAVVVGMLLLLHASTAKAARYALPVYPFLFMMAGVWLADLAETPRPRRLASLVWTVSAALFGLVLVGAPAACLVAYARPAGFVREAGASGWWAAGAAVTAAATLAAAWLAVRWTRRGRRGIVWPLAPAAGAALLAPCILLASPVLDYQRTVVPVAELAARQVAQGREVALASEDSDGPAAFSYYLQRRVPLLAADPGAVAKYLEGDQPRAVIVNQALRDPLARILGSDPYSVETADQAGGRSRDFVIFLNKSVTAGR